MHIISIRAIENRDRQYLAFYNDDFLKAVFSVSFRDTITGALALVRFSDMMRSMYKGRDFTFKLSDRKIRFKNQAVVDVLCGTMKEMKE